MMVGEPCIACWSSIFYLVPPTHESVAAFKVQACVRPPVNSIHVNPFSNCRSSFLRNGVVSKMSLSTCLLQSRLCFPTPVRKKKSYYHHQRNYSESSGFDTLAHSWRAHTLWIGGYSTKIISGWPSLRTTSAGCTSNLREPHTWVILNNTSPPGLRLPKITGATGDAWFVEQDYMPANNEPENNISSSSTQVFCNDYATGDLHLPQRLLSLRRPPSHVVGGA